MTIKTFRKQVILVMLDDDSEFRKDVITISLVGVRKSLDERRNANWKVSDGDECALGTSSWISSSRVPEETVPSSS